MRKVEYVADGWAIEFRDHEDNWWFYGNTNMPTRKTCIDDFLRRHRRRSWAKYAKAEGYRCIRVYRKVSK